LKKCVGVETSETKLRVKFLQTIYIFWGSKKLCLENVKKLCTYCILMQCSYILCNAIFSSNILMQCNFLCRNKGKIRHRNRKWSALSCVLFQYRNMCPQSTKFLLYTVPQLLLLIKFNLTAIAKAARTTTTVLPFRFLLHFFFFQFIPQIY
jgi:hypothetical protein